MKLGIGRVTLLLGAVALSGCASRSAISFHPVAPSAAIAAPQSTARPAPSLRVAEVAAPAETQPVEVDSIAIGSLPAEDVALLDLELTFDSAFGYQLPPRHAAESPSFHCAAGEESLGCAARPAATEETTEPKSEEPVIIARNSKAGEVQ